jgi:hypothetical protein
MPHPGRGTIYVNRCRLDVESASPGTGASPVVGHHPVAPLAFEDGDLCCPLWEDRVELGLAAGRNAVAIPAGMPVSPPLRERTLLGLAGWTALSRLESGGLFEHASHRGLGADSDPVEEAQLAKA